MRSTAHTSSPCLQNGRSDGKYADYLHPGYLVDRRWEIEKVRVRCVRTSKKGSPLH